MRIIRTRRHVFQYCQSLARPWYSFMKFKKSLPNENAYQLDQVRTFIWSLVISIQELHDRLSCPLAITRNSVLVVKNRAILVGKTIRCSPARVKSNYLSLYKFLKEEFFVSDVPYDVENFLNMIYSEPKKGVLISRHYAILPDSVRLQFVNNLHRFPRTMSHSTRVAFYEALDSIRAGDWLALVRKVPYMMKVFQKHNTNADKIRYEHTFFGTSAYWLLKLLRNIHKHAVLRKCAPFDETPEYVKWSAKLYRRELMSHLKMLDKCSYQLTKSIKKGPMITQRNILDKVLEIFPKFYVELQTALDRENLLTHFCIHPQDVLQC